MWVAVRGLHLLAMAFFVGGQLVFAAVVVPLARRTPDGDVLRLTARRFAHGSAVAAGVLVVTGAAMASHYDLWSSSTLQVKLLLVVIVAALLVWHARRPALHVLEALVFVVSLVIVVLGIYLAHGSA